MPCLLLPTAPFRLQAWVKRFGRVPQFVFCLSHRPGGSVDDAQIGWWCVVHRVRGAGPIKHCIPGPVCSAMEEGLDLAGGIRSLREILLVIAYCRRHFGKSPYPARMRLNWSKTLMTLQRKHPGKIGFYDRAFRDWDEDRFEGDGLPQDDYVREKAMDLMSRFPHLLRRKRKNAFDHR